MNNLRRRLYDFLKTPRGKKLKALNALLIVVSLIATVFFAYNALKSQTEIDSLTKSLIQGKTTDKEKTLTLLKYVSEIDNMTLVKFLSIEDYKSMSLEEASWACFYGIMPKNLISPKSVLDYGFGYTGPCGAKSRLLCAMMNSAGYDCRLINMPAHTLAEVKVDGNWTPMGPTFDTYFVNEDGSFASTQRVANNFSFFAENIKKLNTTLPYPIDDPGYRFVPADLAKMSLQDMLSNTIFYMRPFYLFTTVSLLSFFAFLAAYWRLFYTRQN